MTPRARLAACAGVIAALLAAGATRAQSAAAAAHTVTPRLVSANDLRQLMIFDPWRNPFHVEADDEEREGPAPNDSPEYGERALGSLVPPARFAPTDGPLAARSTQSFAYQPHVTTSFAVRDTGGWFPADCTIAAGPSHLVVAFNSYIAFYDKTGQRTFISSLDALFGATAGWKGHFDPKVVYDEGTQRFYAMALNDNLSARQSVWSVAVSVSADPNQGWYVYGNMRNEWQGEGVDYEDLGFGARGLYLCGDYISFSEWKGIPQPPDSTNHTSAFWVFDKTPMLTGQTVTYFSYGDLPAESGQPVFLPRVAQVHGVPAGGVDGFMSAWQNMSNPANTVRISVWGITLPGSFPNVSPSLFRQTVDIVPATATPNAVQLGGPARLIANNLGSAQLTLYYRNGQLSMPFSEGVGSLSGAGLLQLNANWPAISVAWRTDVNDGTNYHMWPNVAVNAHGQTSLSYYRSGAGEYAQSRFATKTIDDPGFVPSQQVRAGDAYVGNPVTDAANTTYRWGDYSGIAVDPVSQGFWFYGMYGSNRGGENNTDWRSWCGYVPRAVYVDGSYVLIQHGTTQMPWNTLGGAFTDADNGDDVVVKAGTYHPGNGILATPVTIIADGGVVELQYP